VSVVVPELIMPALASGRECSLLQYRSTPVDSHFSGEKVIWAIAACWSV